MTLLSSSAVLEISSIITLAVSQQTAQWPKLSRMKSFPRCLCKMAASFLKNVCLRSEHFSRNLAASIAQHQMIVPSAARERHRPALVICAAHFAKKAGKGQPIAIIEEEPLEVNKNPEDLVKYCVGSNYLVEGSDVELGPDSEYPDWLWDLHTGPPKKLEEIEPDTKEYWKKLRKLNIKRNNRLAKLKKF